MSKIFFSNTSLQIDKLKSTDEIDVTSGTVEEILDQLNGIFPGIKPFVVDEIGRVRSRALITKNVVQDCGLLFIDKEQSSVINNLSEVVGDQENLLISIFDSDYFSKLLDNALTPTQDRLTYVNEEGKQNTQPYRAYVIPEYKIVREPVREFVNSNVEIKHLMFNLEDEDTFMKFEFRTGDSTLERFTREKSHIIPSPLVDAIYDLLTDPGEANNPRLNLRLFQEDALFFILGKLWKPESVPEKSLLLSLPTGGGKTEAFVFPLVSHLLATKASTMKMGGDVRNSVKALVLYPTKALANDQAKRLAEIIQKVNSSIDKQNLPNELNITIGIFTGDTLPNRAELRDPMGNFLSLFQVCPVCDQSDFDLDGMTIDDKEITVQTCNLCGHRMTYARVTRADIFAAPPDILITNPDTLNYHIQLPGRQSILLQDVQIIVFDEVHEYNGIFGCNVSHLLRRIEACRKGKPPFYVGLSATIGNAENLAALLFNVSKDDVLYIRDTESRHYMQVDKIARMRHHYLLIPNMHDPVEWLRSYPMTATINVVSALGHAIRDPQFRKILIFSNFKADHDKLAFQIPENERDYVKIYRDNLRPIVREAEQQNSHPILDKSDRAVMRQVARWYEWEFDNTMMYPQDLTVGWHRGALEMEERVRAVNRFSILNKISTGEEGQGFEYPTDVMVATKTLELGIDIGNVTAVLNSSSPFSNNDYVQRIGRGGRRKDSLAITIINPNNAIDAYLREHFDEFVFPILFEDAPIIASNEIIMEDHILARILDYLSLVTENAYQITVGDWLGHRLLDGGIEVDVRENPKRYAELLFDQIFPEETFASFNNWFNIEASVINDNLGHNIEKFILNREWIIDILSQACEILKQKTDKENKNAWDNNLALTGYDAAFPELRPSLRGSGKSVGLYLKKRETDEWKDEISRDRAIYQNPPGSFQSQGRNLFIIDSIKELDQDTQEDITGILVDYPSAYQHFSTRFSSSSLQNPPNRAYKWRFKTPSQLNVRHYPARYICSNPRCGLTYTSGEVTDNLRCSDKSCNWPLNQITRVYRCPQCNAITEPSIPKICINPNCIQQKLDKDQKGNINPKWNLRIAVKKSIKDRNPAPLQGFFRFKSRPNLTWECMDCHKTFSLHERYVADKLGTPILKPENTDLDSPNAHQLIAWLALFRPELPLSRKQAYLDLGYHLNGFNCPDIDHCPAQWKGGLRAVNLPRFQTDVEQFHVAKKTLGKDRITRLGHIYFFNGDVVSLAERYALSDPREDDEDPSEVTRHKIFDEGELYATKFSPHMVGLKLNDQLNAFLKNTPCAATNCKDCEEIAQLELGTIYRPSLHLGMNYIENGKPVQPDPRIVWCNQNRAGGCEWINCIECQHFDFNSLRGFAVLHTLKHGILWALPKYTGLDVGSFKGVVNPGFDSNIKGIPNDLDLLIIDTSDGGSGAIHLINRWWEKYIVPMALEILTLAALPSIDNRRANLNLPYTCAWFNKNLCPVLTGKYVSQL